MNQLKIWDNDKTQLNLFICPLTNEELENALCATFGAEPGSWEHDEWLRYKAEFDRRATKAA